MTKAIRKPEGPRRDHLTHSFRGSKIYMKGEKDDFFLVKNRNLSLSNRVSPLEGLEEDSFYFVNPYVNKETFLIKDQN